METEVKIISDFQNKEITEELIKGYLKKGYCIDKLNIVEEGEFSKEKRYKMLGYIYKTLNYTMGG